MNAPEIAGDFAAPGLDASSAPPPVALASAGVVSALGAALKLLSLNSATAGHWDAIRWPDESAYYLSAARDILAHGAGFFLTPRSLWTGPVNPLWVASWGADVSNVRIANIVLLSAAGLLLWDLARRWWGHAVATVVLLAYSIHPSLDEFAGSILTEPPFVALLVAALWLAFAPRARWWTVLSSGAAFGLATLTRPTVEALPVLVVVAMGAAYPVRALRSKVRAAARPVALFLVGCAVLVGPYVLKNAVYLGKAGIANGVGAVLYLGNDLRRDGDEPVYSGVDFDTLLYTREFTHLDTEGDRRLTSIALHRIREHPGAVALLTVRKLFRLLLGGSPVSYFYPSDTLFGAWRQRGANAAARALLEIALASAAIVFGIFGLLSARRLPAAVRAVLGALVAYFVGVHAILFAIPRMMIPVFPLLCLASTGALDLGRTARRAAVIVWACSILWLCFAGLARHPELATERFVSYHRAERVVEAGEAITPVALNGGIPTGEAPAFEVALEPLASRRSQVVFAYLTATRVQPEVGGSTARNPHVGLSWRKGTSGEAVRGADVPLRLDGEEHIYRFTPSLDPVWPGVIDRLRIRLPPEPRGVKYGLRKVVIAS